MGDAWIGLVGALGGILVTSLFGLVIAVLKHRWEAASQTQQRLHRLSESRAESRRQVYIRFLISTNELGDSVLLRPPSKDGKATSFEEATEQFRELRASADSHFSAYNSAFLEAKLIASADVAKVLDAFDSWMGEQLVLSFTEADTAETGAFFDLGEKAVPLLEAMRREQEVDLAAR